MANLNFNPGDYVKIRLAKEEVEGRVLESVDGTIVLLKLSTGYNVGIILCDETGGNNARAKISPQGKHRG